MPARLKSALVFMGSFALGGTLLYLALRGTELSAMGDALRTADYRWTVPLLVAIILSHVLRAWRWLLLLETLPVADDTPAHRPHQPSLWAAFAAVMIGYMVNYAIPRGGEVARSADLAARTRLRFSGIFGTVVVERILDVLFLGVAIVSVLALFAAQPEGLAALNGLFGDSLAALWAALPAGPWLWVGVVGLLLAGALAVWGLRRLRRPASSSTGRLGMALVAFRDGLLSLVHVRRRWGLLFSTVAMWGCYAVMAYLPLVMLRLTTPFSLSFLDAWVLLNVGALAVILPAPGGTGSYHFATVQTMVHLFAVPATPAAMYALLAHGVQLVLYVALGLVCLLIQGRSLAALRSPA